MHLPAEVLGNSAAHLDLPDLRSYGSDRHGCRAGGEKRQKLNDLHRPDVDSVFLDCPCGGKMKRSPDVFDVWFDSAVASWATLRYPSHEEEFNEWWPADFITEGHDQTRGWFYSQLGASMVSFGRAPYKSVLMHGFTLDDQGRKMSKSIGNIVQPEEVVTKFGADILRFYVLGANAPWEDLHFSWDAVENTARMLNIFWNAYRFALPYMVLDKFDSKKADLSLYQSSLRPEDRWILSRVNSLAEEVTDEMEGYQLHRIVRSISDFILEDLSRWYIQLVRPRIWIEQDDPDKLAAYATIYEVGSNCATHGSVHALHQRVHLPESSPGTGRCCSVSVHMCQWPSGPKGANRQAPGGEHGTGKGYFHGCLQCSSERRPQIALAGLVISDSFGQRGRRSRRPGECPSGPDQLQEDNRARSWRKAQDGPGDRSSP